MKRLFIFGLLSLFPLLLFGQLSSVLSSGRWLRFDIPAEGIYKITYEDLQNAGVDAALLKPNQLQVYGYGHGPLPQENSKARPNDLPLVPCMIKGGNDGSFDPGDAIIFYAEGPNALDYDATQDQYQYTFNIYSDHSVYFVNLEAKSTARVATASAIQGSFPVYTVYDALFTHKEEKTNILRSGRAWYGENFEVTQERHFTKDIAPMPDHHKVWFQYTFMGQCYSTASVDFSINNTTLSSPNIAPVSNFVTYPYAIKGREVRDAQTLYSDSWKGSTTLDIGLHFKPQGADKAIGYLKEFWVVYPQNLQKVDNQPLIFQTTASLSFPFATYAVGNTDKTTLVWDVTHGQSIEALPTSFTNGSSRFSAQSDELHRFAVFTPDEATNITDFTAVENQNIHKASTPDMIIVSGKDFVNQAKQLAQHHASADGFDVMVLTPQEIYNEFSSGRQDITAIRDMARYFYQKSPGKLKYLLLFGDSSYDYKDIQQNNTNFVPIYESRNSLSPVETYASDDYYGFLEDQEGYWDESNPQSPSLDIGIGRIPVKNPTEAQAVVNKILYYDGADVTRGEWQTRIAFVADDGNNNHHQKDAEELSQLVDTSQDFALQIQKYYIDARPQTVTSNGDKADATKDALKKGIEDGLLVINYTGHGNEDTWADEAIFTGSEIEKLTNTKVLPLFVTATCEFGRHDNPLIVSAAERALLKSDGGAIGLLTTSRPVQSSSNFVLNNAFYHAIIAHPHDRLGDVMRETKNNSILGVSNRNFILLGDPALRLRYPREKVNIQHIQNLDGEDTLRALDKITVKGDIRLPNGLLDNTFNGTITLKVFDKEQIKQTLGNGNPVMDYTLWDNVIFQGRATVKNGIFQASFYVPKNIDYTSGKGKIYAYAFDNNGGKDAAGSFEDFQVGGTSPTPLNDQKPPVLAGFMNDSSFTDYQVVPANSILHAYFQDESGINISKAGIGQNIWLNLDDSLIDISSAYYADANTYQSGSLAYPLTDLKDGDHTATIMAWDIANNYQEFTLHFKVNNGNLRLQNALIYPNPAKDKISFRCKQSRALESLVLQYQIIDTSGKVLLNQEKDINSSSQTIELSDIILSTPDGNNLRNGMYFFKLSVRSLRDGAKNSILAKFIINQ